MAINKIDWPTASTPSYTPDIETDYNSQNDNIEAGTGGYNAISLTNWDDSSTAPQVVAGSIIESNKVYYQTSTNTAIGTTGASAGTIYLIFNDTSPYSFEWVDTAPTWSATLNGWYISGDRFTGNVCTWDGASSYTAKYTWIDRIIDSGFRLPAAGFTGEWTSANLAAGATYIIPEGLYMMVVENVALVLEIYDGTSSWYATGGSTVCGAVFSDGVNYRLENTSGVTSYNYRYRKIF